MFWQFAPPETDPRYFQTWQRVSLALQKRLRAWAPEAHFAKDATRYEDRDTAHHLIVYQACRLCYGRPRTEYTYDVADPATLPAAWRGIGRAIQAGLARIEQRLNELAQPELARRYAPVWYQDVLAAVQKKPKRLIRLLASESLLINSVIDWGTVQSAHSEKRFLANVAAAARAYGVDPHELREVVLTETKRVLENYAANGVENVADAGVAEDLDASSAGGPDTGIG